jgi:hypothetical protein
VNYNNNYAAQSYNAQAQGGPEVADATAYTGQDAWYLEPEYTQPAVTAYEAPEATAAISQLAGLPKVAYDGPDQIDEYLPDLEYEDLPVESFASLEDYLGRNTGTGQLTVNVLTADEGYPVPNAEVWVTKSIGGVEYLFYDVRTDSNGQAAKLALPTPAKQLSYAPPQGEAPYAAYTVTVVHNDNLPEVMENVTVFADTESVQVARVGKTTGASMEVVDEGHYTR